MTNLAAADGAIGGVGRIHSRTADVQGAVLGKKVAHWLGKHYFHPLG